VIQARADALVTSLAEHGWARAADWLAPEMVVQLRAHSEQLCSAGRFRHAGVGRGAAFRVRPEVRGDRVLWLDPDSADPALANLFGRMEQLRLALNSEFYLGLLNLELHLAVYPPGACYRPHLDHFRNTAHRVVSCVLYLNPPDWCEQDGGQLRLYLGEQATGEYVDFLPTGGTLMLVLSQRFGHEVLPARRQRWSITGWLCRRP